jgi:hypothetical protein
MLRIIRPLFLQPSKSLPFIIQSRNMTTSSLPAQLEWLCIVPDFPGALGKRLAVRRYVQAALLAYLYQHLPIASI